MSSPVTKEDLIFALQPIMEDIKEIKEAGKITSKVLHGNGTEGLVTCVSKNTDFRETWQKILAGAVVKIIIVLISLISIAYTIGGNWGK